MIGEDEAIKYLEKSHLQIIERNFYTNNGEIDIIAKDKDEYVFIEVKTRISKQYGTPIEAVTQKKQTNMLKASKYFIYKNKLENKFIRFDIIEIYINGKNKLVNHIKNVFF